MKKTSKQSRPKKSSSQSKGTTFHLDCASDPKEIARVEPFIMKVNEVARLDDGALYRLLVAATEAVNNGILHGNKSDPNKHVLVTCVLSEKELTFTVEDEGKGFKPEKIPNPLDEKNLLKTSGRGVFLMRSLMDEVKFHITSHGTKIDLILHLLK
ncbi:MAG: ATP-binding protein [Ignavibacteriales bacterium]|nr:ATP-binding protein [Ignavibacteriales bacterium]